MRAVEVRIEGFGRLVNLSLRFAPGFNLVYGPNEAGKSTLQEALLALLYGLPVEDAMAAYEPWNATANYAGSLVYALDDGSAYRVVRGFWPKADASLRAHPIGEDLTNRFRDAGSGQLDFAEAHWGLSREVFEEVCVVRQGALVPLANPVAATTALRRRLAAAPVDPASARAMELLEVGLKERVGARHSRSRPLAQALARVARLEEERERVLAVRRMLVPRLVELRAVGERLVAIEARRAELHRWRAEAAQRGPRIPPEAAAEVSAEVRRCEAEVARWEAWSAFPAHLRDSLLRLTAQHNRLRDECAMAERRGRPAQEALAALEAQEAALKERLAALHDIDRSPTAEFANVQALASEWRMASELEWSARERWRAIQPSVEALEERLESERQVLEPALPVGVAGLVLVQERLNQARQRLAQAKGQLSQATSAWARLGMDESEYKELDRAVQGFRAGSEPKPEGQPGRRWLSSLLGRGHAEEQAPAGLASYREAQPLYSEMMRCRADVDAAQRALSDIEATTLWQLGKLLGGTLEESAFEQLRSRLERYQRDEAELADRRASAVALQTELDEAVRRREQAEEALRSELRRLGCVARDLHDALAEYARRGERGGQAIHADADQERLRLRMEAELELLKARSEAQRVAVELWQEKKDALADLEAQISAVLAEARITGRMDALDAALADFDEGVEYYRRWERAKAGLDAALRYQRALLESQPRTKPRQDGELSPDAWDAEACAAELDQLDEEEAAAKETHSRLEAEVQQAMVGMRHLAEIDEEIAEAQAEVSRLEAFRDALELARDELAEASREFHQHFGPVLDSFLSDSMRQVSGSRYASAIADPDSLALAVRVPELGAMLPAEQLAASTRGLAYLLLRAGLARLLSRSGERLPLLLDEPLAQCDEARQDQALNLLAQLADDTQVILFSKDKRLKARFEALCGESPRHQVHVLE
jgi:DNA repair exonuclease SbcCD ATPase subunit